MRILLIANNISGYKSTSRVNPYNGGGWITSLVSLLCKQRDTEIGMAFFMNGEPEKAEANGVTYYPIPIPKKTLKQKLIGFTYLKDETVDSLLWPAYEKALLRAVEDFKPDIVQLFGSEGYQGLIADRAGCPVVLHIQGLLNPYWNAYCAPFISLQSFYFEDWNPSHIYLRFMNSVWWRRNCYREREILRRTKYFIGRTTWDQRVVKTYNHDAKYFYGAEVLRPVFYEDAVRMLPTKTVIVSTISQPMYKGFDMVLKTASLMKHELGMDFEWRLFGNIDPRITEQRLSLKHGELNIKLCGVATASQLREELLHCTLYMHPSYIDNSPNSLCEAQLLGVPVVATNVGGVSSMICQGHEHLLVPSNDPYQAAVLLAELSADENKLIALGAQNKQMARQRHGHQRIVDMLLETFTEIINDYHSQP